MIFKIRTASHASELLQDSITQAYSFIKKKLQHRCFPVIKNTYFEKYLRTAASENLSKVRHIF